MSDGVEWECEIAGRTEVRMRWCQKWEGVKNWEGGGV